MIDYILDVMEHLIEALLDVVERIIDLGKLVFHSIVFLIILATLPIWLIPFLIWKAIRDDRDDQDDEYDSYTSATR